LDLPAAQPKVADLGEVRSRHECRNREGWGLAGIMLFVSGAFAFELRSASPFVTLPPLAFAAFWFWVSSSWTPSFVLIREQGLEIHRLGWATRRLEFSAVVGVSWDIDVLEGVLGSWVAGCDLVLHVAGGRRIRLNTRHFKNAEPFFARVWRLCVFPGHQALLDKFDRGEAAEFGKLTATSSHLRIGKKQWAWSDIARAELSPRKIILHFKDGSWRRTLELRKIPYAFTFFGLLRRQRVPLSAFGGFVLKG
jgi:hypothetical protein